MCVYIYSISEEKKPPLNTNVILSGVRTLMGRSGGDMACALVVSQLFLANESILFLKGHLFTLYVNYFEF